MPPFLYLNRRMKSYLRRPRKFWEKRKLNRYRKKSFWWYKDIIASNGAKLFEEE